MFLPGSNVSSTIASKRILLSDSSRLTILPSTAIPLRADPLCGPYRGDLDR